MKITAAQVNELRKMTGAGMMDCKKALEEAAGDKEAAVEILRKKGQKVAAKRSDRDATEGVAIAKTTEDGKHAALIVLNCETDFVAKNDDFVGLAQNILDTAVNEDPADLEGLSKLNYNGESLSIGDKITEKIGSIGEKLELSAYHKLDGDKTIAYIHPGNKLAAIVSFNKGVSEEVGRDVAMQVAAMAPVAVTPSEIPQDLIDKETEIARDLAIQEGKPADMADKIAQGRVNKWFKEAALLEQAFIKDNKKSIKQYLNEVEDGLTVTAFHRVALG
jgi:elongation factor Ts